MEKYEKTGEKLSLPPKIKILEALSTIGDKRIKVIDEKNAVVNSSDSTRTYRVWVDIEAKKAYSNDNGTFYRRYIGYPIIAFLMLKGILPYDPTIAEKLKGIEWRKLNEKYKKYYIVEKIVRKRFRDLGGDEKELDNLLNNAYNMLKRLELYFTET